MEKIISVLQLVQSETERILCQKITFSNYNRNHVLKNKKLKALKLEFVTKYEADCLAISDVLTYIKACGFLTSKEMRKIKKSK